VTVRSIRWLGIATGELDGAVHFLRHVLGMRLVFEEPATTELETDSLGSRLVSS
jgi:catechol 2,3-dioxygenase-like lactoylglutathione lyase family enzyme